MNNRLSTRMPTAFVAFVLMALPILATSAQQAPQQPAPAQNPPATPTPSNASPPPLPQPDGAYEPGSGITSPKIVQATPAVYPNEPPPHTSCFLAMTIGADGLPYNVRSMTPDCGPYQAAAIAAVQSSKFEPGLLDQKPVPVRVEGRVRFSPDRSPALPQIMHNSNSNRQWDTPPSVMYSVDPQYSKEARKKKITGIVNVSMLINEDGVPTDLRVEKSLGYGLDEEAVKCVSQYRFKPAQKGGRPVAARVTVSVNFQIY